MAHYPKFSRVGQMTGKRGARVTTPDVSQMQPVCGMVGSVWTFVLDNAHKSTQGFLRVSWRKAYARTI